MNATSIEWTNFSVNPIRAIDHRLNYRRSPGHYCEKVSSGCANCYASRMQSRFRMPTFGGSTALTGSKDRAMSNARPKRGGVMVNDHIEVYLDADVLRKVLAHKKPARIFWCDMTDLFGWWVPDEWIDKCFAVMALTPHLTHQVLTKRAERMARYFSADIQMRLTRVIGQMICNAFERKHGRPMAMTAERGALVAHWPLYNVWLGVSVEDQKTADERIPHLLRVDARVRFLSCEPLLGPIDFDAESLRHTPQPGFFGSPLTWHHRGKCHKDAGIAYPTIHWIIVGGESGPNARPMHPAWARSIRDQCVAAGVPYFFKQAGEWHSGGGIRNALWDKLPERVTCPCGYSATFDSQHAADCAAHRKRCRESDFLCMYRVGKKAAGRLLDGRTWDEMPRSAV